MSKATKVFKIDDAEFELTQLGGVEGLDLFDRLTAELGAGIMNAIVGAMATKDPEGALGLVLMGGMVKMPAEFKSELRTRFAALSKLKAGEMWLSLGDGKPLAVDSIFDQHFAGRFGHMTRWLIACLKWSFGDFLASSGSSDAKQPAATT